jgi:hypothetical protein
MEKYFHGFMLLHKKEINLHKTIEDENICLLTGENRIYIIDRNDLQQYQNQSYILFHNISKTIIVENFVALSNWTTNYIVYPYLQFKTTEEMESEDSFWIKKYNIVLCCIFKFCG